MTERRLSKEIMPFLYKISSLGADWKRVRRREAELMVKGTNRHVIVVRSPDPRVFEEAIFVLREEYLRGRRAEQAMEEARRTAADYLRRQGAAERRKGSRRGMPILLVGLAVALAAVVVYIFARFFGM